MATSQVFGFEYYVKIKGPLVCGRWGHAKKLLQSNGEHTPLPKVFHEGGRRPAVGGKGTGKTGCLFVVQVVGRVFRVPGAGRRRGEGRHHCRLAVRCSAGRRRKIPSSLLAGRPTFAWMTDLASPDRLPRRTLSATMGF